MQLCNIWKGMQLHCAFISELYYLLHALYLSSPFPSSKTIPKFDFGWFYLSTDLTEISQDIQKYPTVFVKKYFLKQTNTTLYAYL